MLSHKYKWLPHLIDTIPREASKNNISMYTIALEAWRRGITVDFYQKIEDGNTLLRYKLKHGEKEHFFSGSMGDLITQEAVEICTNKDLTYQKLQDKNIPVPAGKRFYPSDSDQDIINYAKKLNYPLVLKPTDGSAGKGVFANIQNKTELISAINNVRNKLNYRKVILQQHVKGNEIRIYVFKDKVISATNRIPANVMGDGKQSIRELIKEKNQIRKSVPHLYYRPIKLDAEIYSILKKLNYNLDTVPPTGKRIFLREISNISTGGDPVDYTDKLTDRQKEIAINATQAIPGLLHCGLDMIIDEGTNSGVIIELNTRPGLGSHLFPIEGIGVDIPKLIIDYYFPETKENTQHNDHAYFDFESAVAALRYGSISEVEIKPRPKQRLIGRRILIKLKLPSRNIAKKIKQLTLEYDMNGFLEIKSYKQLELVIASDDETKLTDFVTAIEKTFASQIKNIDQETYTKPIRIGFEVKGSLAFKTDQMIALEINQIDYEVNLTKNQLVKYKKQLVSIKNKIIKILKWPFRWMFS
ncbi:ATP-grasp domain-containing protein [Amphibacillus sp. Q70]|uniref:ATP-grasp domain-containing protein n=1 Tax=Amphibacillus sp. Q70 TaxID=3453416 RepID=UPI003F859A14